MVVTKNHANLYCSKSTPSKNAQGYCQLKNNETQPKRNMFINPVIILAELESPEIDLDAQTQYLIYQMMNQDAIGP